MEELQVALRLKAIIEALGLTDSQFADKCEISRSTLSLLLSGKNKKVSDVLLSQIHDTYPDVSILWLLFGEGQMFSSSEKEEKKSDSLSENQIFNTKAPKDEEQLNLVNVKQLENIIQEVVNKSFDTSFNSLEKFVLKNSESTNPRKVSKITVYYDDFTFETFTPE